MPILKVKAGLHAAQSLFMTIEGCAGIVVVAKSVRFAGESQYLLGLCFCTVIALIYQLMGSLRNAAWTGRSIYIHAVVDLVFAILWFIAVVVITLAVSKGQVTSFEHVRIGRIGLAGLICVLFVGTTIISTKLVLDYRRTGELPRAKPPVFPDTWNIPVQAEPVKDKPYTKHWYRSSNGPSADDDLKESLHQGRARNSMQISTSWPAGGSTYVAPSALSPRSHDRTFSQSVFAEPYR
ncbi:hypothetical protein K470DRAFT_269440 [Piedraia hortae CBS 480.64]|uniref:MARVEL domain-containing protein n=1 Tax=Piedraia hortae CBS 480.64 TaxID=1314780 RepID=A0A6A7C329_9PEZI|nr:hypothetical protein K470DRAFT_269440 [Piedraia hortae CBS 480.64]